ncbi:hypothetical protein LGM71_32345 [Burkholderia sp. AU33545]|uniref:hypothetical protein n=1 Tax=Burkholderia sp. AU33545 TaxID=2879631 RepID=UPI001CF3B623|nr:hypothetical protein [Burkholderia sp. AU33545]MCA8205724.1 hypothetical protein [Burkholderia sp. AU33545]
MRAEHEIDLVPIRYAIRLKARFDRIHPALRQMSDRRRRPALSIHMARADHDTHHRLPGPSSCFDLFRERTFYFGAPSNPILSTIFKHGKYTTHAHRQQCGRLHKIARKAPIYIAYFLHPPGDSDYRKTRFKNRMFDVLYDKYPSAISCPDPTPGFAATVRTLCRHGSARCIRSPQNSI